MYKRLLNVLILITLILTFHSSEISAQNAPRKLYVNVESENLRSAPQGKKIGSVLNGTEAVVLVEQEKWIKVQITGWIWKGSMTQIRPRDIAGQMRALHILVATKDEADAVLKELNSGKDFSELAKAKSVGPNAKNGGDLGYFSKGDFQREFENTIQNLKVGEISKVVETKLGYHIFKRLK
jgi:parvulin-like peptidyl-prolyl isomerase